MSKFRSSPFSNLIENLTENITPADVQMSFGQIMLETNMGQSLINIGKSFIPSDSSPLGKSKNGKDFFINCILFNQLLYKQLWFDILYYPVSR